MENPQQGVHTLIVFLICRQSLQLQIFRQKGQASEISISDSSGYLLEQERARIRKNDAQSWK